MDAWDWLTFAEMLFYAAAAVVAVAGAVVGAYLMIARNPQTHIGIARDCEREGRLEAALKHYRLAERWGRNKPEGRLARQKVAELEARLG